MSNKIKFKCDNKNLTITIPVDLLKWAAENNSETPLIIHDELKFAKEVMFELEDGYFNAETGLTKFQQLLDEVFNEVVCSGHDFVDVKEQK